MSGRQPAWVDQAVDRFASRLPKNWRFELSSLPIAARPKNFNVADAVGQEGKSVLATLRKAEHLIALDERGIEESSSGFAERLGHWQEEGHDLCFVIAVQTVCRPRCCRVLRTVGRYRSSRCRTVWHASCVSSSFIVLGRCSQAIPTIGPNPWLSRFILHRVRRDGAKSCPRWVSSSRTPVPTLMNSVAPRSLRRRW